MIAKKLGELCSSDIGKTVTVGDPSSHVSVTGPLVSIRHYVAETIRTSSGDPAMTITGVDVEIGGLELHDLPSDIHIEIEE